MDLQILIVTLFACGLTLIVSPWVEKKLDDYLFKRKLKKYGVESTGNRYRDRFRLLLSKAYVGHWSDDDLALSLASFEYRNILLKDDYYDSM